MARGGDRPHHARMVLFASTDGSPESLARYLTGAGFGVRMLPAKLLAVFPRGSDRDAARRDLAEALDDWRSVSGERPRLVGIA